MKEALMGLAAGFFISFAVSFALPWGWALIAMGREDK